MEAPETSPATTRLLEVLGESDRVVNEVVVDRRLTIGRGSEDFAPDILAPPECRSVSRKHAALELHENRVLLTDSSRFGTRVNGIVVVDDSVELRNGDVVVFGLPADGLRARFVVRRGVTSFVDPLQILTVSESPRQVRIGRLVIEERLGDRAFRLLKFLVENKGVWYPMTRLEDLLWPDPDKAPYQAAQALSRCKRDINDLLKPHLNGQEAIESWPHKGYRMKPGLDGS